MEEIENKIEKLYYTIGEVAEIFDVNTSLIRDIENFHLIYNMVKERGMTLKGAQKKLKENREDTINSFEIIKSLKHIREMMLEIKELL